MTQLNLPRLVGLENAEILDAMRTASKTHLKRCTDNLSEKRRRLQNKLRLLGRELRYNDMTPDKLDEYQKVNEELRIVRIFEAELTFAKNTL